MKKTKKEEIGLKHKKSEFSEWYNEAILNAGLADYSSVSGCQVIKPYGYAIWEKIIDYFNKRIKAIGHKNAYFPLFIPERFLHKEAEHFEGFIPEVAFIEKKDENEERFALRPTSETIIYDSYSKWIRSWRDLPLKINQWCNIVRWETKMTKLFLRTREFLWQEGHTVHATCKEADKEVMDILKIYTELMQEQLAIPVLTGKKTEKEKFAGALYTTTLEAFMPDGRALQMGTSHNMGQNFSKPFNIKFKDKDEKDKYAWTTSWGISTRLIGALVMVHGDDKGLVLPPKIAPTQVVIIPIIFEKSKKEVFKKANEIKKRLSKFSVEFDDREEYSPGWKFNEWELKGVPIRLEIGPKDVEKDQVVMVRRDTGKKEPVKLKKLESAVEKELEEIQKNLFKKAKTFLNGNIKTARNYSELKKLIKQKKMVKTVLCNDQKCEDKIKDDTTASIRLIPFNEKTQGKCPVCGKKAKYVVYIAREY